MPTHSARARTLILGALMLCSLLCGALLVARVAHTGTSRYVFLVWNLFLAWLPLVAALALYDRAKRHAAWPGQLALGAAWLLTLPNAPYIVTDIIHLRPRDEAPLWFDALLIVSFAFAGVLLGLVSLYLVHVASRRAVGAARAWVGVGSALVLASFGIYLGRVERWNSWDVLAQPSSLLRDIAAPLADPFAHSKALVMTAVFAAFLACAYLVLYSFAEMATAAGREASQPRSHS